MSPYTSLVWAQLGIPADLLLQRNLPLFEEADELVDVAVSADGRIWQLIPAAAQAWRAMQAAALADGIELKIASAYRASSRQVELIQNKLNAGFNIDDILQVLAPPGCSEHHTGRAVDIFEPGGPVVTEAFETTPAFVWLSRRAGEFGFTLSFPRENQYGYVYEPWHWCWHPATLEEGAVTQPDAAQHIRDVR